LRAKTFDLGGKLLHHFSKFISFRGGNPLDPESPRFHPGKIQYFFCCGEPSASIKITRIVMTITRMTAANQHTIRTKLKCPEYEGGIDTAGTHHPDNPDILRVLQPGCSGKVRSCVGAPITGNAQYLRFKRHKLSFLQKLTSKNNISFFMTP
jgi:hypothetical protein